jgi:hypothetical protein
MNSPVSYDIETDKNGNGFGVFLGRFSVETFAVSPAMVPAPRVFFNTFPDSPLGQSLVLRTPITSAYGLILRLMGRRWVLPGPLPLMEKAAPVRKS